MDPPAPRVTAPPKAKVERGTNEESDLEKAKTAWIYKQTERRTGFYEGRCGAQTAAEGKTPGAEAAGAPTTAEAAVAAMMPQRRR